MIKKILTIIVVMILYPVFFGLITVLVAGILSGWSDFLFWPPFALGAQIGIKVEIPSSIILIPILWLISRSKRRNEQER